MKALVLTDIRRMEMVDRPEPDIENAHDVLLRLEQIGVCGSDIHYYVEGRIGSQVVRYPFAVGHECSATVLKVGPAVTRVKPGDRVAVEPAIACGTCDQCLSGRRHTCRRLRFLGCPGQLEGCLMERIVMPEACCFPLPDGMDLELGALVEPLSIGLYAVRLAQLRPGRPFAILGAGPIGLSVLIAAKSAGAGAAYVTEPIPERRVMAEALGAVWTGDPYTDDVLSRIQSHEPLLLDTVFECSGKQEAMDLGVRLLAPGGRLMLIGIPSFDRVSFEMDLLRRRELCLQNVRRQNECVQSAIELAAACPETVRRMVTHRYAFDRTVEAFDLVADYRDGVVKAMIDMATAN